MQTPIYALVTRNLTYKRAQNRKLKDPKPASDDGEGKDENFKVDSVEDSDGGNESSAHIPFAQIVVNMTCDGFLASIKSGAFVRAKLLLRFLCELANCKLLLAQDVGSLMKEMINQFVSADNDRIRQVFISFEYYRIQRHRKV
jgi:hypothetical protein